MKKYFSAFILLSSVVSLQAQVVGAIPDTIRMQQPFGQKDAQSFLHPDKIFYPET